MSLDPRLTEALELWQLRDARLQPLAGDVSHRRYFRLSGGGLSGTAVAVLTPLDEAQKMRDWIAVGQYLAGHGVPVPGVRRTHEPGCAMLIDDVGDRLLSAVNEPSACYTEVLDDLARLELAAADEPASASPAHGRILEETRIRWELRRFRKVVAAAVRDLDDREALLWKSGEDAMAAALAAAPKAWMHRDLHARNLLCCEGRTWWIDFQDAMIGPWLYDQASLLFDPYAALDEPTRARHLEHYLRRARRIHAALDAAAIESLWRLVTVQRLVHCVACYVWVKEHLGNDTYVRYLPYALEHLRAAIERCAEAAPFGEVLASRWESIEQRWSRHAVAL